MSKLLHNADAADDDARAMTIPRRSLRKQPKYKIIINFLSTVLVVLTRGKTYIFAET